MFKINLRTIAQVSAIATTINWGCQFVLASSQDISPSSFTTLPIANSDRPSLLDRLNTLHLEIAVPGLMRRRYYLEACEHLARSFHQRARCSHAKNLPHHWEKPDIHPGKKLKARLPQFAKTAQLDRLTSRQSQVKMPELYARVKDR